MKSVFSAPRLRPLLLLLLCSCIVGGPFPGRAQAIFNASSPRSLAVTTGGLSLFSSGLISVTGSVDYAGTPASLSGTTVIGGDLRVRAGTSLRVEATGKLYVYGNIFVQDGTLSVLPGGHLYCYGNQLCVDPTIRPFSTSFSGGGTLHFISPRPAPGGSADGQQRPTATDGLAGGQDVQYFDGALIDMGLNIEHRSAAGLTIADLNGDRLGGVHLNGTLTLAASGAPLTLGNNTLSIVRNRFGTRGRIVGYSPSRYVQTNGSGQLAVEGLEPDSSFVFPIGHVATGDYTPARLTNREPTKQSFALGVSATPPAAVAKPSVARYWQVSPYDDSAIFDLMLEHNALTSEPGYNDNSATMARYNAGWIALGGPQAGKGPGQMSTDGPVAGASAMGVLSTKAPGVMSVFTKQTLAPLPVELTLFTAQRRAGTPTVALAWHTATERNCAGFEVQRSADGLRYDRIDWVPGAGTSITPLRYALATPYVGAAYYRLRQVDLNGTWAYSPVRFIAADPTAEPFAAYPCPTSGPFRVSGADPGRPVQVLSLLGQMVSELPAGQFSSASLPALSSGIYIIRQGTRQARLLVE